MTARSIAPVALGLAALAAGCVTPAGTAPVLVRDAETHAPVPGAEVRVSAARTDWSAIGTTGPNGVVRFPTAGRDESALLAQVSAPGYLPRDADLTGRVGAAAGGPAVVELFPGPRPSVELIIPAGFRGVVRVRLKVGDESPSTERMFTTAVSPNGTAEVAGPPVLVLPPGPDFTARYADGARLGRDPQEATVGLRWLWAAGTEEVFVVGTRADLEAVARSLGYAVWWLQHGTAAAGTAAPMVLGGARM